MRVTYNISENAREEVSTAMRKEKSTVIQERLLAVSMFLDGVQKGEIKKLMHGMNVIQYVLEFKVQIVLL